MSHVGLFNAAPQQTRFLWEQQTQQIRDAVVKRCTQSGPGVISGVFSCCWQKRLNQAGLCPFNHIYRCKLLAYRHNFRGTVLLCGFDLIQCDCHRDKQLRVLQLHKTMWRHRFPNERNATQWHHFLVMELELFLTGNVRRGPLCWGNRTSGLSNTTKLHFCLSNGLRRFLIRF